MRQVFTSQDLVEVEMLKEGLEHGATENGDRFILRIRCVGFKNSNLLNVSAIKILFGLTILVLALVGCDYIHGVSRVSPEFQPYPRTECVLEAVKSIEGMSDVSYREESGSRPLTLRGVEKHDEIHRFWYQYKGLRNNFYFRVSYNGNTQLFHGYGCFNCTPPQEDVDRIYPAIIAVEQALETQCGISGLARSTKEFCSGVKCSGA